MTHASLSGGFATQATDSAHAFRVILDALSRPGTIHDLSLAMPPAPLSRAAGTLALTLLDGTTPVYLAGRHDTAETRAWLTFHTGAPFVPAAEASFAFGAWEDLLPLERFAIGTPEYPDRAATLVIEGTSLSNDGAILSGPGIRDTKRLSLPATAPFIANRALFPLGFDTLLTADDRIAGLPRSTVVRDA